MAISINGTTGISGVDGSASTPALQGADTNTGISFGTDEVAINTGGTERVKVDSSGRLLAGTSSVVGTSSDASYYALLTVKGAATAPSIQGQLALVRGESSTSIASGETIGKFTFADSDAGNYGEISCVADGTAGSSDYPGRLVFSTTADAASSPTERMRLTKEGRLDVFADTPFRARSSTSPGTSDALFYGLNSATSTTNGTAVYAIWTNGTTQNLSDQRQKKNIETTRDGYLQDLQNLRVVKYHWNTQEDDEPKELGLIAQEVEQVFPGLVSTMDQADSDMQNLKGIKTSVIQFMLLKALQEAADKIETLEAKVAALEGGAS